MRFQKLLILFFIFNLAWMVGVSVWATESQNVILGINYLFANRWGIATLSDTYFAFTIIFLWMAYKENSWFKRIVLFVLVWTLGTIAISIYALLEISRAYRVSKQGQRGFMEAFLLKQTQA